MFATVAVQERQEPGMVLAMRSLLAMGLLLGCASQGTGSPLADRLALIRAVHPVPHRTVSEAELDGLVAAEEAAWGISELGDARALRRIVARLGDSHVAVGLPVVPPGEATFVPFLVKRVGDGYRVDAATESEAVGAEVVAVEGVPIDELMDRLSALATVDGDRPSVRLAEAERRFAEHARLELGARDEWSLVTRSEGAERTWALAGVRREGLAELELARRSAGWGSRERLPSLEEHDGITVLRLASFGTSDRAAYLERIEALAPDFTSAERLVIDLRGNEGGDRSLGVAVARHLLEAPFAQWASVRTRVRAIPEPFASQVSYLAGDESALTGFPGDPIEDGWRVGGDPLAATMVPTEPSHRGPLTLFVDDATNSAAVELAVALLAHHPAVTVVGAETQGECAWHVGQLPIVYQDEAGPALLLSLFEIELVPYEGCRTGRGIEPDVPVVMTAEDFDGGRDPFLDRLTRP
ncbi:MAG: hypothetical protein JJ863_32415 [Deltaproteobacteria bacterium]|nr:hypothetical protein [Deltaproteobacteria bacterium]